MNAEFKNVLGLIDKVALKATKDGSLFDNESVIGVSDEQLLCDWSGKSIAEIKAILAPAYGKRQIQYNPFMPTEKTMSKMVFIPMAEGESPAIHYSLQETMYGRIILASTQKGICYLVFFSGNEASIPGILQSEFPGSVITEGTNEFQAAALDYLNGNTEQGVSLHVKGSAEQLQIWKALTHVRSGKLISYGTLAKATGQVAQDIGMMMGDNRIAMLIPCHRVVKATGELGQYHWGAKRKRAMIIHEARLSPNAD